MREFMCFIRKGNNSKDSLTDEKYSQFLNACENYIKKLKKEGKLIAAQPIEMAGKIISRANNAWEVVTFNDNCVIRGYYHIFAKDMNEAVAIAKANPEFKYNPSAKIEVHPVKMKEENKGNIYPK